MLRRFRLGVPSSSSTTFVSSFRVFSNSRFCSSSTSTTTTKESSSPSSSSSSYEDGLTKPHNEITDGEGNSSNSTSQEVTQFLNQFQYAAPEFGLKISPPDLAVDLLEYQKEGVGWMARREHFHSGGIMADFLGMGKTVQMIALCLARQQITSKNSNINTNNVKKIEGSTDSNNKKEKKSSSSSQKKNSQTKKKGNSDSTTITTTKDIERTQKEVDKLGFVHGEPFRIQTVIQQLLQIPAVMNVSRITQPGRDLLSLQGDVAKIVSEHNKAVADGSIHINDSEIQTRCEENIQKVSKELDKWLKFAGKYYVSWEKRARHFLAQSDKNSDSGSGGGDGFGDLLDTPELRTLIIVPASLVYQWKHEIENKIDASRDIKTMIYHGSKGGSTSMSAADLEMHDFVITTYDSVVRGAAGAYRKSDGGAKAPLARNMSSSSSSSSGRGGDGAHGNESMGAAFFNRAAASSIFRVRWKRIILDEAHYVRNEKTIRFGCIRQLLGLKRWAVTATPLHNSIQDLQTLLTFVGQPRLPLFDATENLLLKDPVLQRAIARSLQPAFLRRTPVITRKGVEHTLLVLPTKDDVVVRGDLQEHEIIMYNEALQKRQQALSAIKDKSFVHVFAMMTLLRQACCHPWMTEGKQTTHQICFLCQFEVYSPIVSRCGHAFCRDCLHMAFRSNGGDNAVRLPCPACEVPIPFSIFNAAPKSSSGDNIVRFKNREWIPSSKIDMLLNAVSTIRANHPDDKIVVFAQFTTLLDIISVILGKSFSDMRYVRIDGSLSLKIRNGLIQAFSSDPKVKILLASKMAMGVGLNLTAANHVIIIDPWWNPRTEEQCLHRCHRIGQKKHVSVQRFIMNDTIEQYCYEVSRKKQDFGDAVIKAAMTDEGEDTYQSPAKQVAEYLQRNLKPVSITASSSSSSSS